MATQETTTNVSDSIRSISGYHSAALIDGLDNDRKYQSKSHRHDGEKLAQALGWFSIGLGLGEILAPKQICKIAGLSDGKEDSHSTLLRAFGGRELASGIGILSKRKPTEWMWSRVAGDIMDLACLTAGFASPKAERGKLSAAIATVAGVTVLDILCAKRLSRSSGKLTSSGSIRVIKSIIVNRPAE